MLETTTSAIDIKGLEKIPANHLLLAETRSVRRLMYGALEELQRILRTLVRHPNDTFYSRKLYCKIDESKVMLTNYEHKLDKLYSILPDGCGDMDQLRDDFNTCREKFVMVKQESMCVLPEETPSTPSPQVAQAAESKPSTEEKEEVPCGSPETGLSLIHI